MVNRILAQSLCSVFDLPYDIYTFGGLELVTDIVTQVRTTERSSNASVLPTESEVL